MCGCAILGAQNTRNRRFKVGKCGGRANQSAPLVAPHHMPSRPPNKPWQMLSYPPIQLDSEHFVGGAACARIDLKRSLRSEERVAEQATHWIRVAGTIGHPDHAKNRGECGVMGVRASIFRVFLVPKYQARSAVIGFRIMLRWVDTVANMQISMFLG